MSRDVDIITGINSLDDVLHTTGYVLQYVSLDDLRVSDNPKAKTLQAEIESQLRTLGAAIAKLLNVPDDIPARKQWADAANRLQELDEDVTILLP